MLLELSASCDPPGQIAERPAGSMTGQIATTFKLFFSAVSLVITHQYKIPSA